MSYKEDCLLVVSQEFCCSNQVKSSRVSVATDIEYKSGKVIVKV
jgi:hypothetical protein